MMRTRIAALFLLIFILAPLNAHAACWQWSLTAASNATADPTINWSEGMAPSGVNDSGRAMMARLAECRDDLSGKLESTGTSAAYAVATNQANIAATPGDGQQIVFRPHATNAASATLALDGGTAFPIQSSPGVAVASGVMVLGVPYRLTFDSSASSYLLQDFFGSSIAAGSITTAMLQDEAVTYQKIQDPSTTSRILGTPSIAPISITGAANNGSGLIRLTVTSTADLTTGQVKVVRDVTGTTEANGTWTLTVIDGTHVDLDGSTFTNIYVAGGVVGGAVEELVPGGGLKITGNNITAAQPPPGSFKNLVIKVTGNTGATVSADFVTTTDGTTYQTTAVSCTLDLSGGTGINKFDTGGIASATWYAVWVMAQPGGTTGCTASLQGTANATFLGNRPAGYTFYARVGWLRTAAGSAQLMGTWQFGRVAQYVVGLAQTTTTPGMASGTVGDIAAPTWIAVAVGSFVPTTASVVRLIGFPTGTMMVAPNNSYGAFASTTNPPPLVTSAGAQQQNIYAEFLLESTNIYWASNAVNNSVRCFGWEDNI